MVDLLTIGLVIAACIIMVVAACVLFVFFGAMFKDKATAGAVTTVVMCILVIASVVYLMI